MSDHGPQGRLAPHARHSCSHHPSSHITHRLPVSCHQDFAAIDLSTVFARGAPSVFASSTVVSQVIFMYSHVPRWYKAC